MTTRLVFGALTPLSLGDPESGAALITTILRDAADLAPSLYGNSEPVRSRLTTVDQLRSSWSPPLLWKARGGGAEGSLWFDNPGNHSALYISAKDSIAGASQALTLLLALAEPFALDFGYVHLMTEAETTSPDVTYDMWYPLDVGVTSSDLIKGIPLLPWALVLGPPYTQLLGRERLLSSSAYLTRSLSSDRFLIQLTPHLEDVRQFGEFSGVRNRVRQELGAQFFAGIDSGSLRRPTFNL